MLVRNLTTSVIVDDSRNNSGDERLPIDAVRDYAYEIQEAKELASIAVAARQELSGFVVWLADQARSYAIDNALCGNYERFLSLAVGNKRDELVSADSIIRDDVEAFVVNATRPRRSIATVNVPVVYSQVGVDGDVDAYTVAYNVRNGGSDSGDIHYDGATIVRGSASEQTLTYNESQRANENYSRRGTYENSDYGY